VNTFQKLFAVSPSQIREDVIITPFLKLEYFRINGRSKKGFLFEVLNEDDFSVIKTGIGASFVGDALMYLKEAKIKRVYFLGSCGAISNLDIGDLVLVSKALNMESFSNILNRKFSPSFINAEDHLYKKFLEQNKAIKQTRLATVGSLSLEEGILPLLNRHRIDVIDMEVSAFICAARFLKLSYMALLYVTDILRGKSFCRDLTNPEQLTIQKSRQEAISLLCEFIRKQNA
jgi:purine-nucleoside phosphorylase